MKKGPDWLRLLNHLSNQTPVDPDIRIRSTMNNPPANSNSCAPRSLAPGIADDSSGECVFAAADHSLSPASGWIALHRSEEAFALLENHPNAFLLLTQIAIRAKWKDCQIAGLKAGQALIGDWKKAGLPSEKAYRHAKKLLARWQLAAFQGTNKGTVATLSNSIVFSISNERRGEQRGGQKADKGHTRDGQGATNEQGNKENTKTPPSPPNRINRTSSQKTLPEPTDNGRPPAAPLEATKRSLGGRAPYLKNEERLICPQQTPRAVNNPETSGQPMPLS